MWYQLKQLSPILYQIREPGHVSFYVIKNNDQAILVDSGLGLAVDDFKQLLEDLGISHFSLLSTHLHCDHAGLNFLASKVYLSHDEYRKYLKLKDDQQILNYYSLLQNYKSWPVREIKNTPNFENQIVFIQNDRLKIYDHEFEVISTPGHTIGHLCFISHKLKCIFLGDLIYDGMLYLNLPDSNFDDYIDSLERITHLVEKTGYTLLPCHNSIPLDENFVRKAFRRCSEIKEGIHHPTATREENAIFKACDEYVIEDIKIQITKRPVS